MQLFILRWEAAFVGHFVTLIVFIKFSTSDNAILVLWLVHSITVISSYTLGPVYKQVG